MYVKTVITKHMIIATFQHIKSKDMGMLYLCVKIVISGQSLKEH